METNIEEPVSPEIRNKGKYEKQQVELPLQQLSKHALFWLIGMWVVFLSLFFLLHEGNDFNFFYLFYTLVAIVPGIVIHEGLHGIVAAAYAPNGWKSLRFGAIWKHLIFYCHCKDLLRVKQYRRVLLTPYFVLGLFPTLIALVTGNLWLLLFGIIFQGAAFGDVAMFYLLRKEHPETLIFDHPSKPGYFIYREKSTLSETTPKNNEQ